MTKVIRIGNSAFATETENLTNDANGCYRIILLRSLGYEAQPITPFDRIRQKLTFALGHANEEVMAEDYAEKGHKVERERVIKGEIYGLSYEGHIDLTVDDLQLVELKGVSSINSYVDIIRDGHYKLNNLAQLVSYLFLEKKQCGVLRYTNFIYSPAAQATGVTKKDMSWDKISPGYRDFLVEIDFDTEQIVVDRVPIPLTLENIRIHKKVSAEVISKELVHSTPLKTKVCSFCMLRDYCSKFNKQLITEKDWLSFAKCVFQPVKSKE